MVDPEEDADEHCEPTFNILCALTTIHLVKLSEDSGVPSRSRLPRDYDYYLLRS